MAGEALKVIDIEDEGAGNMFRPCSDNLQSVLKKLPNPAMKVAIVSIVGAFRTGKSFILNLFLRYLRYISQKQRNGEGAESLAEDLLSEEWMFEEGEELLEGNLNTSKQEGEGKASFAWRGGYERMTTGIWMWSEPFIIHSPTYGEDIAVLLMDTQGMFDNVTGMTLTAQIFGFSTLVSSYQIYNVQKLIGEDNLQHLALFSEYGRMAVSHEVSGDDSSAATKPKRVRVEKPFQRLQFLVRDYQSFDEDIEEDFYSKNKEEKDSFFERLAAGTNTYLGTVIEDKETEDLQTTRNQIKRCFEHIDCYLLPHPGSHATKKTFSGNLKLIDPAFRVLVNYFVRKVFGSDLMAKQINGRFITGFELENFFNAYAKMFQTGNNSFPQAMTMLEATAEANNRNSFSLALTMYKTEMDAALVPTRGPARYLKEEDLKLLHSQSSGKAMALFDDIASMGSDEAISRHRKMLEEAIEDARTRYFQLNALQNPFKDVERYVLPMTVGVVAYILSKIIDNLCSHDFCENTETALKRIYMLVFFLMFVTAWSYFKVIYSYAKEIVPMILQKAKTA